MENKLLAKIIIFHELSKIKKRRQERTEYIRNIFRNRRIQGELFLVKELRLDPYYHHRYFRMSSENYSIIHDKIRSHLEHGMNHALPISSHHRLAITLRYLASGNSQVSMSLSYRVSPTSVCKILRETLKAICETMGPEYLKCPSTKDFQAIASDYEKRWNFPLCVGSMDGKQVRMKCPPQSGSSHFNYKSFFSVVLFAVVDAKYQFSLVDIGRPGAGSDGGVLIKSPINRVIENTTRILPADGNLSNGEPVPHVFIGDDAFPLKKHLMRPYAGKWLAKEERTFNYRLSRARRIVENAFGILAARWRIYHSCIEGKPDLVILIIKATIILHNFLMKMKDLNDITIDKEVDGLLTPGNWRDTTAEDSGLEDLPRQGSNNYTGDASKIRDTFRDFFLSDAGSVSWQNDHVMRGSE